jgi:hypothetical protein
MNDRLDLVRKLDEKKSLRVEFLAYVQQRRGQNTRTGSNGCLKCFTSIACVCDRAPKNRSENIDHRTDSNTFTVTYSAW